MKKINKWWILSIILGIGLMNELIIAVVPSDYGNCQECGLSWNRVKSPHMISISDHESMFYVCDDCWNNLTSTEKTTYEDIAFLQGNNISYIDRMVYIDSINFRVEIHKLTNYDDLGLGKEEPKYEIAYNVGMYDSNGRCSKRLLLKYKKCRSDKFIEVMKEIESEINNVINENSDI